jgi:hypothetical protein
VKYKVSQEHGIAGNISNWTIYCGPTNKASLVNHIAIYRVWQEPFTLQGIGMARFYMYKCHEGEAQNHLSNYAGYAIAKHNINKMQRQKHSKQAEIMIRHPAVYGTMPLAIMTLEQMRRDFRNTVFSRGWEGKVSKFRLTTRGFEICECQTS